MNNNNGHIGMAYPSSLRQTFLPAWGRVAIATVVFQLAAAGCSKKTDHNGEFQSFAAKFAAALQTVIKEPNDIVVPSHVLGGRVVPATTLRQRFIYDGQFAATMSSNDPDCSTGTIKIELAYDMDELGRDGKPANIGKFTRLCTIPALFTRSPDGSWNLTSAPCREVLSSDPTDVIESNYAVDKNNHDETAKRFRAAAKAASVK